MSWLCSKLPPTFGKREKRAECRDGRGRLVEVWREHGRCRAQGPGPQVIWRPSRVLARCPSPSPVTYTHSEWSHLSACFPGGETEACTFEEEVGLGQVQLVPEGDTRVLHSCAGLKLHAYLQLGGPGDNTQSASRTRLQGTQAPGPAVWQCARTAGPWPSPGHWLCGSTWRACPPGPASLLPASCSL